MDKLAIQHALSIMQGIDSLNRLVQDNDHSGGYVELGDLVADTRNVPNLDYTDFNERMETVIKALRRNGLKKEAKVLQMFLEGKQQSDMVKVLGVGTSRVGQIVNRLRYFLIKYGEGPSDSYVTKNYKVNHRTKTARPKKQKRIT